MLTPKQLVSIAKLIPAKDAEIATLHAEIERLTAENERLVATLYDIYMTTRCTKTAEKARALAQEKPHA
jgi:hypothetical protein